LAEDNHYGATAARAQGRPGREMRPRSVTVDMHSHVMVPEAAALTQPHIDLAKVPLAHFATDDTKALNRKQDADRRPNMVDMAVRLADMDAAGIDVQVIMPPPPQCTYAVPLGIGIAAARIVNAGLASFAAQKPERFAAIGTVPMQDGPAAAAELERSMREDGMKGAQILTSVNGLELSDPRFAPFWAKAEELGAVVLIHPNGFTEAGRMSRFYFNNVIGNPLETTLALHYLIFDGVLERHPALKLVAVHGGGYLASYSGRIDHAWGALGRAGHPAAAADGLPEAGVLRFRGVHAAPVAEPGGRVRRREGPDGDGLPLRHGRERPCGPPGLRRAGRGGVREDRRGEREGAVRAAGRDLRLEIQHGRHDPRGGPMRLPVGLLDTQVISLFSKHSFTTG